MWEKSVANLFILGPSKVGSTSLWENLRCHPEINPAISPKHNNTNDTRFWKEPQFFSSNYEESQERCNSFYKTGKGIYNIDASTMYFMRYKPIEKIARHCDSNSKFICILRHPVERFISSYRHFRALWEIMNNEELLRLFLSNCSWRKQFETEMRTGFTGIPKHFVNLKDHLFKRDITAQTIRAGDYYRTVERMFKFFPKSNILFIRYQDFREDNEKTYNRILDFLELEGSNNFDYNMQANSRNYWLEYFDATGEISKGDVEDLTKYYRPGVEILEDMINIKMEWF